MQRTQLQLKSFAVNKNNQKEAVHSVCNSLPISEIMFLALSATI